MNQNFIPFSIVFLGICIVLGSWLISQSFAPQQEVIEETKKEQTRYDFITIASDYFIIFEKKKGEYGMGIGDSDREKQDSFSNSIE